MTTERQSSVVSEQAGISPEEITRWNIKQLVKFYNFENGHNSKTEKERKQIEGEHESLREFLVKRYGEESIANLLPTNSMHFRSVIHKLSLSEVNTEEDLIKKSPLKIKYTSDAENALIGLMRYLAKFKSKAQTSK